MATEANAAPPDTWAIVDLMGHVRIAGRLTEEERFGVKMGRLDMPTAGGGFATRYFGGASVYSITIVSEEAARAVAVRNPEPVSPWEMPKQLPARAAEPYTRYANEDDDCGQDNEDTPL